MKRWVDALRSRGSLLRLWACGAGLLLVFSWFAANRLIARDEGYYLLASQLVAQGRTLYRDFFYPQMPLLPYLYGGWMSIFGFSWLSARTLSALIATAIGTLVFAAAEKRLGSAWGLIAATLYAGASFVLPWYVTAQTYALSALFLTASVFTLCPAERKLSARAAFVCGLLLGLAVMTRLFFAGLYPLFLAQLYLLSRDKVAALVRNLGFFAAGSLVAFTPALWMCVSFPEAFYFNNLGYHLIRSDADPAAAWQHRLKVLAVVSGLHSSTKFDGLQFALLVWGTFAYSTYSILSKHPRLALFPAAVAGALFFINALPTPPYVQYWSTLVPLLAYLNAGLLAELWGLRLRFRLGSALAAISLGCYAWLYCGSLVPDLKRYTTTGIGVIGIGTARNVDDWRITSSSAISEQGNKIFSPNAVVYSVWPGHLVGTHVVPLAGTENYFGVNAADDLSLTQRGAFKLRTKREVYNEIASRRIDGVVVNRDAVSPSLMTALKSGGYRLAASSGRVNIWQRDPE